MRAYVCIYKNTDTFLCSFLFSLFYVVKVEVIRLDICTIYAEYQDKMKSHHERLTIMPM